MISRAVDDGGVSGGRIMKSEGVHHVDGAASARDAGIEVEFRSYINRVDCVLSKQQLLVGGVGIPAST